VNVTVTPMDDVALVMSVGVLVLTLVLISISARRRKHPIVLTAHLAKGARVKVYWPAMKEWYAGTIKDTAMQDGVLIHCIRYDDECVEWRDLAHERWQLLLPAPAPPKRATASPKRAAASPKRAAISPKPATASPKRSVVAPEGTRTASSTPENMGRTLLLSPDFTPTRHFLTHGYEIHNGVLDAAAIEALGCILLHASTTRPINGEAQRRQRMLEAGRPAHARVTRCLDALLCARGLLLFEPSVIRSTSDTKRQRAHRDRGEGSLLASFRDGTHLWVAPGSHLQPASPPTDWEASLVRIDIPAGCAILFHPLLVHAGGDASCPPRVHAYALLAKDRVRMPISQIATYEGKQGGAPVNLTRLPTPTRADFGDGAVRE
jgi:hypothetical protein